MNLLNWTTMNKLTLILGTFIVCSCSNSVDIKTLQHSEKSYDNTRLTLSGIVSGVYQKPGELDGFYMQQEGFFGSSGLFVHSTKAVSLGDEISLSAKVIEYKNETRLDSVSTLTILSKNKAFKTQTLDIPFSLKAIEKLEGCLVSIPNLLQIADSYSYEKYGQLLVSANDLVQATELYDAQNQSKEIEAHIQKQYLSSILLDDLSNRKYPSLDALYAPKNSLVVGSKIKGIKGYLCQKNDTYYIRLQNDLDVEAPNLNLNNYLDGKLKLMSFNLHNLFNGDGEMGGFPTSRGAKTYDAYVKQSFKLAAAISLANPDVIALMELENDGEDSLSAVVQFCEFLNLHSKRTSYKVALTNTSPGTDVIKTGVIYDASILTLASSNYHSDPIFSRNPIFSSFTFQDSLAFVVAVNHFKSKGSRGAEGLNKDQEDGQGAYNEKRGLQAAKLLQMIDSLYSDDNCVVLGDFNAYSKEDPIQVLASQYLMKLPAADYSYVYKGRQGDLDHAFISKNFAKRIYGLKVLDINASYPNWTDYRFENADAGYYRSSDHNPLLIGIY